MGAIEQKIHSLSKKGDRNYFLKTNIQFGLKMGQRHSAAKIGYPLKLGIKLS